ncbi:hypothetical protein J7L05_11830 [bacterium]|nr:hypothetical protein [bacterium]
MRLTIIFFALVILSLGVLTSCSSPSSDTSKYFPDEKTGSGDVVDITAQQGAAIPNSTIKKAEPKPEDVHKIAVSPGHLPKCVNQFAAAKKVWERMKETNDYYGCPQFKFDIGDKAYINGNPLTEMSESPSALEERIQKEKEILDKNPELKTDGDKFKKSKQDGTKLYPKETADIQKSGKERNSKMGDPEMTASCTPVPLLITWDTSKITGVEDVKSWGAHATIIRIKGRRRGIEGNWYLIRLIKGGIEEMNGWLPETLISANLEL